MMFSDLIKSFFVLFLKKKKPVKVNRSKRLKAIVKLLKLVNHFEEIEENEKK